MTTKTGQKLYDVVAVDIQTSKVAALFGERETLANAEAIVKMAVFRRGVEEQFYAEVPTGKFKEGDTYSREDS